MILDPRLNEEEVAALLTKVQETLKTLGGEGGNAGAGTDPGLPAPAKAQRAGPAVLHDPGPGAQADPDGPEAAGSGGRGGRLMANLNRVFLIGNLQGTPELRTS